MASDSVSRIVPILPKQAQPSHIARMLHFKTTPQKDEYESATFTTPFIGLRWHF
jgi:SAM-dependent methyltransferase